MLLYLHLDITLFSLAIVHSTALPSEDVASSNFAAEKITLMYISRRVSSGRFLSNISTRM